MNTRPGHEGTDGGDYRPGLRVRVRLPRDPHTGGIGTVQRNYNDGGDMVHVVRFEDGTTARYDYHDLAPLNAQ